MKRLVSELICVIAACFAVPALTAGLAAAATYAPTGGSASSVSGPPGSRITVSGSGFQPGSSVTVEFFSTPVVLGTTTADATGRATASVSIPSNAAEGPHTIELIGVNPSGAAITVSIPFTVTGGTTGTSSTGTVSGSTLATTGARVLGMGVVGLTLLATGGFFVYTSRRRTRSVSN